MLVATLRDDAIMISVIVTNKLHSEKGVPLEMSTMLLPENFQHLMSTERYHVNISQNAC